MQTSVWNLLINSTHINPTGLLERLPIMTRTVESCVLGRRLQGDVEFSRGRHCTFVPARGGLGAHLDAQLGGQEAAPRTHRDMHVVAAAQLPGIAIAT